jgi:glycine betaine/choline ABC-type transport system substrate-binding protein
MDEISAHLTTDDLRSLNDEMAGGRTATEVAAGWLTEQGLR